MESDTQTGNKLVRGFKFDVHGDCFHSPIIFLVLYVYLRLQFANHGC